MPVVLRNASARAPINLDSRQDADAVADDYNDEDGDDDADADERRAPMMGRLSHHGVIIIQLLPARGDCCAKRNEAMIRCLAVGYSTVRLASASSSVSRQAPLAGQQQKRPQSCTD